MIKDTGEKLIIEEKRYGGETAVVSARLSKQMIAGIDRLAKATGHNRNEILSLCLSFALDRVELKTGKEKGGKKR